MRAVLRNPLYFSPKKKINASGYYCLYKHTRSRPCLFGALFIFICRKYFSAVSERFFVVFSGTLISKTSVSFIPILLITTFGSTIGFIAMYYIGEILGDKVIRKGRFKFIKPGLLEKADHWFHKYGYKIILINRFMPGTRAVVSFFSGVHHLKEFETFFFAGISSLFWNAILICLGIFLGNNLKLIDKYLKTYSNVILIIMAIAAVIFIIRFWLNKKKKN